jgi:NADH:ubiquinone oxidoreductase subunit 4 (subunit M)
VDSNLILVIIAAVLALPSGLFVDYIMSEARARMLSLLGGIIGDVVVAAVIYLFVTISKMSVDALSYFIGAFFGCSIGVFCGALVANFLVNLSSRGPAATSEL